jgi:hypothetical protein
MPNNICGLMQVIAFLYDILPCLLTNVESALKGLNRRLIAFESEFRGFGRANMVRFAYYSLYGGSQAGVLPVCLVRGHSSCLRAIHGSADFIN